MNDKNSFDKNSFDKTSFINQKNQIEKNRIKNAILKSVSIAAISFSVGILFMSIALAFGNIYIAPIKILKVWMAFFLMGIFTFFRIMFDTSKWALSKPFIIKNLLFMPLYLVTALVLAMDLIKDEVELAKGSLLLIYAGIFLVVFSVRQFIEYFRQKAKTELMNDALYNFQKEHKWDEEE